MRDRARSRGARAATVGQERGLRRAEPVEQSDRRRPCRPPSARSRPICGIHAAEAQSLARRGAAVAARKPTPRCRSRRTWRRPARNASMPPRSVVGDRRPRLRVGGQHGVGPWPSARASRGGAVAEHGVPRGRRRPRAAAAHARSPTSKTSGSKRSTSVVNASIAGALPARRPKTPDDLVRYAAVGLTGAASSSSGSASSSSPNSDGSRGEPLITSSARPLWPSGSSRPLVVPK